MKPTPYALTRAPSRGRHRRTGEAGSAVPWIASPHLNTSWKARGAMEH
ncbi:hypothetical protein [Verticiella sediminum]|nr:hypothetical protein [Verticiella sediminum]